MIKLIGTAYRKDDFSQEEFIRYWNEVHAPISGKVPGLRGYVVSEVVQKLQGSLDADAFVELWWDDMESFERAGASPEQAEEAVDQPVVAAQGRWDAGIGQTLRIGLALVSQGVVLRGDHERGRHTSEVGCSKR